MKKVILGTLFIGYTLMAYEYRYTNPSLNNNNNNEYKYQGNSGVKYKYDLNNQSDQIRYSTDVGAQLRDSINVNPRVDLDRGLGQYGGGIER